MTMPNSYWRNRELNHIQQSIRNDEELARRLRQKYMDAMNEIESEIEAFYGRYASREGISMEEARKRVNALEIEEYERKAKRYVRERNFSPRANEEMRLYNVTMRINRMQLLRLNIELELMSLISDEERFMLDELTKQARAEYERQSGILGQTINANEQNIASIVNSSFLSATWSDRLWSDQVALRAELDKLLNRGIVQGLNPRELARELRKVFNTSIYNSERLLRTELGRVQGDVARDSFKQADIEQYVWIAEPSACPLCKELDDKIFNLKDAEVGINYIPRHPNCLCSVSAYVDRETFEKDLESRGL